MAKSKAAAKGKGKFPEFLAKGSKKAGAKGFKPAKGGKTDPKAKGVIQPPKE